MSGGNFFLQPAYNESVSAVTLSPSVMLGSVRVESGEEYIYLYNDGSTSTPVNPGQGVVLSSHTGYSVTISSISGYDMFIAFCKHTSVPTAGYFWGLTRGFTNVKNGMVGTALAQGDPIFAATQGGVQKLGNVVVTALSGSDLGVLGLPTCGTVVSACASGGTGASIGVAYVRCFGT